MNIYDIQYIDLKRTSSYIKNLVILNQEKSYIPLLFDFTNLFFKIAITLLSTQDAI